ncbi:MAG TPA: fatty acid desaturase [Steroidobacteraceae bacterium]|nr:fatty acid desaturase [Steroidobacteraceae bacterium]
MESHDYLKHQKCAMVGRYATSKDTRGLAQVFTTLAPFALLWWAAIRLISVSPWLALVPLPFIILLTVRAFGLMHECGHGSLFRSRSLNRLVGFLLGVLSGMPQYVWSQHHNYHHAHNGNWDKYRGPYTTLTVDEYAALNRARQWMYRFKCSVAAAPLAGFIYLIFNPRFTWLKGSIGLLVHAFRQKLARPGVSLQAHAATYRTRYWKSAREYRHMLCNNLVLFAAWALMCFACGMVDFFCIYVLSVSIAGGAGIVLFTVQHNFKHSYASDGKHWDQDTGTIEGTSYLVLPRWLNWFTVDIGYHHIHHLSASIPNYSLAKCHHEYGHLFSSVTRVTLCEVPGALKCILWDRHAQRIISVAEYRQRA